MMYEVSGGTKAQRKVVDEAMSYVIDHVDDIDNAYVYIELGKYQSNGVIQIGSKTFEIEVVKTVSMEEIVYTICHEMKHVEQIMQKRLVYKDGKSLWLGEDHTGTEYHNRPWEKEAYYFERIAEDMLTSRAA